VIQDGEQGSLVTVADSTALAAAIARYVEDPALAARHGQAARERIEQRYSMHAMLSAYTGLYDTLCREKLGRA
jgi:glycosyltransferase involved in cell wall biosynthesis